MRKKGIAVIVGIVLVIGVTALLQNSSKISPGIEDQPTIVESTKLQTITNIIEEPEISESVSIQVENEVEFTVDENGTKTFIIKVTDSPKVNDG